MVEQVRIFWDTLYFSNVFYWIQYICFFVIDVTILTYFPTITRQILFIEFILVLYTISSFRDYIFYRVLLFLSDIVYSQYNQVWFKSFIPFLLYHNFIIWLRFLLICRLYPRYFLSNFICIFSFLDILINV